MKFLQYLQEEYLATAVSHGYKYEILINPDAHEITKLKDIGIRFIIDRKTKDLYISAADFIHPFLLQYLIDKRIIKPKDNWINLRTNDRFLMGTGGVVRGKIKIERGSYDFPTPPNALKDFDWAKHFFTNFEDYYKDGDLP